VLDLAEERIDAVLCSKDALADLMKKRKEAHAASSSPTGRMIQPISAMASVSASQRG
jgi:hypothetical protein